MTVVRSPCLVLRYTIKSKCFQRTAASETLVPLLPKPGITAFKAPTKVKYKKHSEIVDRLISSSLKNDYAVDRTANKIIAMLRLNP